MLARPIKMPHQKFVDEENNCQELQQTQFINSSLEREDLSFNQNFEDNQELLEENSPKTELIKEKPTKNYSTTIWFCILFNGYFLCQCAFIITVFSIFFIFGNPMIYFKKFQNYEVYFNTYYSSPVSSTIFYWSVFSKTKNEKCQTWEDNSYAWIKIQDYDKLPKNFVKGKLTPYMNVGSQTCSVLNIVPQFKCHSEGVWKNFENFVSAYHYGKLITTFPIYGKTNLIINQKKIYIPEKLCKKIDGENYCIAHTEEVCEKNWCEIITPKLSGCK